MQCRLGDYEGEMMQVLIETMLPMAAHDVLARLRTTALLRYAAAPIMHFVPLDPSQFPEEWAEGEYRVATRLFGLIPLGQQTIDITFDGSSKDAYAVRDNGHGDLARRWDHRINVVAIDDRWTCYRDTVDVEAGLLTPFVWLFAQGFYRHRQRRWRMLARAELTAEASARKSGDP